MTAIVRDFRSLLAILAIAAMLPLYQVHAQNPDFHNAPASARALKNPYEGQQPPNARALFHLRCARCHGENGEGSGNIPPLKVERIKAVTPGEIFWFITKGDVSNGMPSWATLPRQQRWQIVSYVQALGQPQNSKSSSQEAAPPVAVKLNAPPPTPPFTDFRYEKPGQIRKFTLKDLPAPFATSSAGNGPKVVTRPEGAWPQVPEGFKVEQYAAGLDNPRIIRAAPNGDIFVAETMAGDIRIFRGITSNGKPQQMALFRQRPESAFRHQLLSSGTESAMGLRGKHRRGRALPLSERRLAGPRPGPTPCRSAGQRRPFHARYSILARWQEDVRLRRLSLERRRSGYHSGRKKSRRHSGIQP